MDRLEKEAGVDRLGKEGDMDGFSPKHCALYSHSHTFQFPIIFNG